MDKLSEEIKSRAKALGFDVAGIAPAAESAHKGELLRWLEAGHHGEMSWLARDPERRADPRQVLPNCASVVVVGMNYRTVDPPSHTDGPPRAKVSRYAWGDNYHRVFEKKLKRLCAVLTELGGWETATRYYVDTGPVLERDLAAQAGLGWIGKHGNLVSEEYGSWLFLGVVLTSLALQPDTPAPDRCGTCTACLEACPTQAFPAPYILDARRCVSYLTIEHRGEIPETLRPEIGDAIFGCDICLEVCPWNRHQKSKSPSPFEPRKIWFGPKLTQLLQFNAESFQKFTQSSPVRRAKLEGLLRNSCIVAGNSGDTSLLPKLRPLTRHPSETVRQHAEWAIQRIDKTTG